MHVSSAQATSQLLLLLLHRSFLSSSLEYQWYYVFFFFFCWSYPIVLLLSVHLLLGFPPFIFYSLILRLFPICCCYLEVFCISSSSLLIWFSEEDCWWSLPMNFLIFLAKFFSCDSVYIFLISALVVLCPFSLYSSSNLGNPHSDHVCFPKTKMWGHILIGIAPPILS